MLKIIELTSNPSYEYPTKSRYNLMNALIRIALVLISFCSLKAFSQTGDGPFGYDIGANVDSYSDCTSMDGNPGYYRCTAPAKPHPDMEMYLVQAFPSTGVCLIKGIGKDIDENGWGSTTKAAIDRIVTQIESVYGSSTDETDLLMPTSIWDENDEWLMGIKQDDRYYFYTWDTDDGYQPKKNIRNLYTTTYQNML